MKLKIIVPLFILYLCVAIVTGIHLDSAVQPDDSRVDSTELLASAQVDMLNFQLHLLISELPQLKATRALLDTITKNTPIRYGDVSLTGEGLDPSIHLRTDRIGEFILRFNGDSTAMATLSDKFDFTSNGKHSQRIGHILSLINDANVLHNGVLVKFAYDICRKNLLIDEGDGSNYIAIPTMGYVDVTGEIFPVRFILCQSAIDGAPIWYVKHVDSPYFTYGISNKPYYIDFVEREFDFMGLSKHNERSAASIAGPDFKADNLSTFLFLYHKGLIRYDHAESSLFIFSLGDYAFRVELVESFEHKRSGYLITKIVKGGKVVFENRPVE